MGQGLSLFECHYYNCCFTNTGVSVSFCCIGCWCCASERIKYLRGEECLQTGFNQGIGGTLCCLGNMCCVPEWVRDFSIRESIGTYRGKIYNLRIDDYHLEVPHYVGGY
jgi:hypothetical protein